MTGAPAAPDSPVVLSANFQFFGNEFASSGIYVFTGGIVREIRELSDGFERLLAIERVRTPVIRFHPGRPSPQAKEENR